MSDRFRESIEEAYERGVEAGRLDAVPPGTEPMKWCETHNSQWRVSFSDYKLAMKCYFSLAYGNNGKVCELEDPVRHWVTVKEETT